jgi:hypothetical protein
MTNPIAYSWASKTRTIREIYQACKSDILKIYGHSHMYHNIVVEHLMKTFEEFLTDSQYTILSDMIDVLIEIHNSHHTYHDDNDTIFSKYDITIVDVIDKLISFIDHQDYQNHYALVLLDSNHKKADIVKRLSRCITTELFFKNEFYGDVVRVIARAEEIYVSNGYTFNPTSKMYKKNGENTNNMTKYVKTDIGIIDSEVEAIKISELMGVCKYSISKYPVMAEVLRKATPIHYDSVLETIKETINDSIKLFTETGDCEYLVMDKKRGLCISCEIADMLYTSNIKGCFSNEIKVTDEYSKEHFLRDLGIGEQFNKKIGSAQKKFRPIQLPTESR